MAPEVDPTADLHAELPAPPMSPALAGATSRATPVRTRVPARSFALVLAIAIAVGLVAIAMAGARPDAHALPLGWLLGMGLVLAAAGPFLLARAILPPRGQVLPSPSRAARSAVAVAAGLVLLGLVATVDAPGVTVAPHSFWSGFAHCAAFALRITLPVLLVGALSLRHVYPMGAGQIAVAVGAAGGAFAGLVLHVVCPLGGGAHVGFAHGGAAVIGGGIGALVLGRLLR